MANYETGHHINVDNLDPLMKKVALIGPLYNPAKQALTLTSIATMHSTGKSIISKINDKYATWKLIVDDRQARFKQVPKIVTRVIGNLYGMEVPASFIEDAKEFQAKINSTRLVKPKAKDIDNDQSEDETKHSVSQQSFNSVLKNFSAFVALIAKQPNYETEITDLTLAALWNLEKDLQKANSDMNKVASELSEARIDRNLYFYTPETGLVDIAKAVKNVVKGIFDATHPTYLDIKKIRFKNIRRN